VRWSAGGEPSTNGADETAGRTARVQVHTGPIRYTHGQGFEDLGVVATQGSPQAAAGIAATARTAAGSPTATITDTTTVEVGGGMRTSAKVAANMGLLQLNPDGRTYSAPGGSSGAPAAPREELQQQQQQQKQQEQEAAPVMLGAEEEAALQALAEPLQQTTFDRALALTARSVATGDDEMALAAIEHLAQEYQEPGDSRETARARAEAAYQQGAAMYQDLADRAVMSVGLSADEVDAAYAFMRSRPAELNDAILKLTMNRDARPFRKMAREFMARTR
jgi:hypothetical protein